MELLVIRHAIAVERREGMVDADRPLTGRGRRRLREVVRGLAAHQRPVELVLTSPWRRAVETAARLRPLVVDRAAARLTRERAAPPGAELLRVLASTGVARLAVVGDEPWLSELVGLLIAGDPRLGAAMPFKKAGVAVLDGEVTPGGMALVALLPPRLTRRMG